MISRALRTCNNAFVLEVRNLQAHGLAHLVRLACHKRLQPRASSSSSSICKPISIQPFQLYSVCKAWVNADMALMPTACHRQKAQCKPPMLILPFSSTITWGHSTGEQYVLLHALLRALTSCVTATLAAMQRLVVRVYLSALSPATRCVQRDNHSHRSRAASLSLPAQLSQTL